MKTWVRKSLKVGILSAGFLLVGGTAAAQAAPSRSDNFRLGSGNQVVPVVVVPIDVTGNAVGVLGTAQATGHSGGSSAMVTPNLGGATSGNFGVGNGNQVVPGISIPIDICGNAIGLFGGASASCGSGLGTGSGGYGTGTGGSGTGSGGYGT